MDIFSFTKYFIYVIFFVLASNFIGGMLLNARIRQRKYQYKKFYICSNDVKAGLSVFSIFLIILAVPLLGSIYLIFFGIVAYGGILYYLFIRREDLKLKFQLMREEKILTEKIKLAIKTLPDKRFFTTDEVAKLFELDRATIKKYERDLVRFTVIYSKFGDDIYTKEEVEIFIICYALKNKGYDLPQLKSKIIDYAKKLDDLAYFKKMKNIGFPFNPEGTRKIQEYYEKLYKPKQ